MTTQYTAFVGEIVTFDGLYTSSEIAEHISFIKSTIFDNKFSNFDFKNGRMVCNELSNHIHDRLLELGAVQKHYVDAAGRRWEYVHTAPTIFYANYTSGQHFTIHTDTGSVYNPKDGLYSKFTLLTYLNENFKGGETRFFNSDSEEICIIHPKVGRTLIFDIDLMHCGSAIVGDGAQKYWIGTELVYQRVG